MVIITIMTVLSCVLVAGVVVVVCGLWCPIIVGLTNKGDVSVVVGCVCVCACASVLSEVLLMLLLLT